MAQQLTLKLLSSGTWRAYGGATAGVWSAALKRIGSMQIGVYGGAERYTRYMGDVKLRFADGSEAVMKPALEQVFPCTTVTDLLHITCVHDST